jgi:hypothetical protein
MKLLDSENSTARCATRCAAVVTRPWGPDRPPPQKSAVNPVRLQDEWLG